MKKKWFEECGPEECPEFWAAKKLVEKILSEKY